MSNNSKRTMAEGHSRSNAYHSSHDWFSQTTLTPIACRNRINRSAAFTASHRNRPEQAKIPLLWSPRSDVGPDTRHQYPHSLSPSQQ